MTSRMHGWRPASQNDLLAHEGKIAVRLVGSDFEFASKVELKKTGDEFAVAEGTKFLLPKVLTKGRKSGWMCRSIPPIWIQARMSC